MIFFFYKDTRESRIKCQRMYHERNRYSTSRSTFNKINLSLPRFRTLYLSRYFALLYSFVYDRAVWFHFTSAKPRDGLASFACRSLTSTFLSFSFVFHRPPCALVFFFLFGLLSNSRLPRRTYLHLLVPPFDLRESPKIRRKEAGKIEEHSILFSTLFFFLFIIFRFISFLLFLTNLLSAMSAGHSSRIVLFSECPTDSFLITLGLNSCGYLGRALRRDKRVALPHFFQSSSSRRSFQSCVL